MRATFETKIGHTSVTLAARFREEFTPECVRVVLPDSSVVIVIDVADLDRWRAAVGALKAVQPVEAGKELEPEIGGEGGP